MEHYGLISDLIPKKSEQLDDWKNGSKDFQISEWDPNPKHGNFDKLIFLIEISVKLLLRASHLTKFLIYESKVMKHF